MDRNTYIGSSEAAAVLGLSKWRTPLDVYLRKTGQIESQPVDPKREKLFRRGRLMEPVVMQMLEAESPVVITKKSTPENPNRIPDAECEFLGAEIDFEWTVTREMLDWLRDEWRVELPDELLGTTQNGEVKTVAPFAAGIFGETGTDEIPIDYAAQAMHGLMVTGRQVTLFPVLVGSDNLLIYVIKRDDAALAGMRDREIRFWLDNVVARKPPEPIRITDIYKMLKRELPRRIEATPDVAAMIATLKILKAREASAKDAIETIQFELGCFIYGAEVMEKPTAKEKGRHAIMVNGEAAMWISHEAQERVDADMLREKHPAIAAECIKPINFMKFNLKRKKS